MPQARPIVLGPYPAHGGLHYPLADGDAQSPLLAFQPGELPELVRQTLGGYPPALVGDRDGHMVALPHSGHPYGRHTVGVPGRVGEEVV